MNIDHWGPVITLLLCVISALLAYISTIMSGQQKEQKLFNKEVLAKISQCVSEKTCEERREGCVSTTAISHIETEVHGIKADLIKHSHTGLPGDSAMFIPRD